MLKKTKQFFKLIKYEIKRVARNKLVFSMLLIFSLVLLVTLSLIQMNTNKYPIAIFTDGVNIKESGWCSELYVKSISGYNDTQVNVSYDVCNPFGMIAGDFGEISSLNKHKSQLASKSTIDAFNSLSDSFATFMSNFEIPTDGTEYIPDISSDAQNSYTQFYNKAIELYNSSLVSFTKNVGNNLTRSAVIGVNHPYTMTFRSKVNPELVDFQTAIANLFGFSDKTEFMNHAQNLANIYAEDYESDGYEALKNGCFHTENGSFVFPLAVNNEMDKPILMYMIVDANKNVSVWVNDITTALRATNFNEAYHTENTINNTLYCNNILFVTGPEVVVVKLIKENLQSSKIVYVNSKEEGIEKVKKVEVCFFICLDKGEETDETTATFYYDQSNTVGQTVSSKLSNNKNKYAYEKINSFINDYGITLNETYFQLVSFEPANSKSVNMKQVPFATEVAACSSIVLMLGLTYSLARDNETNVSRNIAYIPVGKNRYLWSKIIPYFILGIIQLILMYLLGAVCFKINYETNILIIILLSSFFVLATVMLGLLFSLFKSQIATIFLDMLVVLLPVFVSVAVYIQACPVIIQIFLYMLPMTPFLTFLNCMMYNGVIVWWNVAVFVAQIVVYYLLTLLILKKRVQE